jgi:hypothetical protein
LFFLLNSDWVLECLQALDDIWNCDAATQAPHWVWTKDWIRARLATFPSWSITWDYSLVGGDSNQLLLEPGYVYTLTAEVAVVPIHQLNRLEIWYMVRAKASALAAPQNISFSHFSPGESPIPK